MTGRIETLLRFAARTRRFVAGATGARVRAERKKEGFLLIATDLDDAKAASIRRWAGAIPVPVGSALTALEMGNAIGRDRCNVIFVYDRDISRSLGNALGGRR